MCLQKQQIHLWTLLQRLITTDCQSDEFHQLGANQFSPFNATSNPRKQAWERKWFQWKSKSTAAADNNRDKCYRVGWEGSQKNSIESLVQRFWSFFSEQRSQNVHHATVLPICSCRHTNTRWIVLCNSAKMVISPSISILNASCDKMKHHKDPLKLFLTKPKKELCVFLPLSSTYKHNRTLYHIVERICLFIYHLSGSWIWAHLEEERSSSSGSLLPPQPAGC